MYSFEVPTEKLVKKTEGPFIDSIVKISLKDNPKKFCMMTQKFIDQDLERIKNMEIFEDDIWIVTFPKSGTTWTQEMIWMLNNNLDYETSSKFKLDYRFPFIEMGGIAKTDAFKTFDAVKNSTRPRYIKSHLPLFLLPDQLWTVKPKIIYTARNPKDTAVSFYHHHTHLHGYKGSINDFIQAFYKDLMLYSPMNDHILDFWKVRNEPNVLFLFYEDMKRDLDKEVKRAMKFLGKDYSQEQIDKLCQHLSFDSVKKNEMINKNDLLAVLRQITGNHDNTFSFMRKGKVGGYKEELTVVEIDILDDYGKDSELMKFGFEYKY